MLKKNQLDNKYKQKDLTSTLTIKNIAATVAFLMSILCISPSFGQNNKKQETKNKKDTTEYRTEKKTSFTKINATYTTIMNFDSLKKIPIWKLEKTYGLSKTIEILLVCNIDEINKLRNEKKIPMLVLDTNLIQAAQLYAQKMAESTKFGHRTNGNTPAERGMAAGYPNKYISENLLYYDGSIEDAIKSWQKSPTHFETLMDDRVSKFGAGYYKGYWVNMFGMMK